MRTVIVPTPNNAQKTKIARPRADSGAKSPYPIVVNATKPIAVGMDALTHVKYEDSQKYMD